MKKKLSLLGVVLILILSLMGCGSRTEEKVVYDQAAMEQQADMIIMSFSSMEESEIADFREMSDLQLGLTLLNSGLRVETDNFLTMTDAWTAGVKECGAFVERGDYKLERNNEGAILTTAITCADRTGNMEFAFDERMNMESMTINADYAFGEILTKAGLNTVLGMGTVFVVLIFISFIISLFKYIPAIEAKFKKTKAPAAAAPVPAATPATVPAEEETVSGDSELVAAIAAAIAVYEGTSADGFVVRSIKRRKSNKWN